MPDSFIDPLIGPADRRPWLRPAIFVGVALAIAALFFIGVRKTAREVVKESAPIELAGVVQPKISITIDDPQEGAVVAVLRGGDGSGSFPVGGSAAPPDGASLYLLVRPIFPAAKEWWVMPEVVFDPTTSRWTATAIIGNTQYPPVSGNRYALCVVAARPGIENGQSFASPAGTKPFAQSKFVYVTAGAIR